MKIDMKRLCFLLALAAFVILMLSGCADVSHVDECLPEAEHTYGFWGGVWHGMIAKVSFIGSLIWDDVAIYAVNNNGAWYDFGFIGGLWIMLKALGLIIKGAAE